MNLTREFTDAVMNQDTIGVRIMLKDAMLLDPSMRQFNEMLKYASENMDDIYDEHDGEELITDKSQWDKSYMNGEMVAVVGNFSRERVALLKNIVKYLYMPEETPKKTVHTVNESRNTSSKPQPTRTTGGYRTNTEHTGKPQPEDNHAKNPLGMGMAVAGAAVAVTGICTAKILLAGVGTAVAAAGVVNIIMHREDN